MASLSFLPNWGLILRNTKATTTFLWNEATPTSCFHAFHPHHSNSWTLGWSSSRDLIGQEWTENHPLQKPCRLSFLVYGFQIQQLLTHCSGAPLNLLSDCCQRGKHESSKNYFLGKEESSKNYFLGKKESSKNYFQVFLKSLLNYIWCDQLTNHSHFSS